jgi:hypothetical protein
LPLWLACVPAALLLFRPSADLYGRTGFVNLVKKVHALWKSKGAELVTQANSTPVVCSPTRHMCASCRPNLWLSVFARAEVVKSIGDYLDKVGTVKVNAALLPSRATNGLYVACVLAPS